MKIFLQILLTAFFLTAVFNSTLHSQSVPEILYYKFNNGVNTTPNYADPGAGSNPAVLVNMTLGPGGQFDSALVGNGGNASNTYVQTGWPLALGSGSWTISLWINNYGESLFAYIFGGTITSSFRCFSAGAAGPGNITLRAGGGFQNVDVNGVLPGPSVVHFVYDASAGNVKAYLNGVLQTTVSQPALNINDSDFKVGSYGTTVNSSIPVGSLLDEFRLYSRALDSAEIAATWDQTLPLGGGGIIDPTVVCDYGLIPQYPGGGLGGHASEVLGDTLYIVGGDTTTTANVSPSTKVTRYAINSGEWSVGTPLPTPRLGGDLVKCGDALYYIGGGTALSAAGANNTTYKYEPATGWSTVAPIPTPVVGNVAECWGDSVILCMAGGWTQYYRGIQIYRPSSNTWSRATDSLPSGAGRRSFAGGISGNKLFVAAGWSGVFRKDMLIGEIGATAESITWSTAPEVPMRLGATGSSRPGGHAVNGRFYFVSGETSPAPPQQDSIYIYDVAAGNWLPEILVGRGANTTSNYWGAISSKILNNNKIKIFIPGGFWPTTVTTTKLFVLTDSIGCIITNLTTTASELPQEYVLSQNYPNPFNPVTKIQFSIPEPGLVKLKVYDLLGREVRTLVNEFKSSGQYVVDFNASGLSSGVYFYKFEAGEFSDVKKMLLLK